MIKIKIKIKTITLILILLTTTLTTALAETPGQTLTNIQDSYALTPIQWIINWVEGLWIDNIYYKQLSLNSEKLAEYGVENGLLSTNAVFINQLNLAKDFANNVKTTAIIRAKAKLIEEYENTHNATLARQAALRAIDNVFNNATKNIIISNNITVINLIKGYNELKNINCEKDYNIKVEKGKHIQDIITIYKIFSKNVTVGTYTIKRPFIHAKVYYDDGCTEGTAIKDLPVIFIHLNTSNSTYLIYNYTLVENTINDLEQSHKLVKDNFVKFGLNLNLNEINVSKLIDPYVLAQEFSTDYNTTGYYGYAAAMLAMSGLPTTGINKTVSVTVGNKTLNGFMFTDWNTVFSRNHTYQVPNGKLVWILTPNGLYKIPEGTNFTVSDLRDWQGNRLNSTRMQMYVDPSLNAQNFTKSIEQLIQNENALIKAIDNQTTTASGGNKWANAINGFWDGLDWQVKAIIVFAAIILALILIGRSLGKGGVRVG